MYECFFDHNSADVKFVFILVNITVNYLLIHINEHLNSMGSNSPQPTPKPHSMAACLPEVDEVMRIHRQEARQSRDPDCILV